MASTIKQKKANECSEEYDSFNTSDQCNDAKKTRISKTAKIKTAPKKN